MQWYDSRLRTFNEALLSLIHMLCTCMYILHLLYCTHLSPPTGNMCPDEVDSVWKIKWSITAAGFFLSVPCVENNPQFGMANRTCNIMGVWDPVDALDCESEAGNEIKMEVDYILHAHL